MGKHKGKRCPHDWQPICISGNDGRVLQCIRQAQYCEKCGRVRIKHFWYSPILETARWKVKVHFRKILLRNQQDADEIPF